MKPNMLVLNSEDILLIVDVQKSFSKFFTQNYLNELFKYCKNFKTVYQIWDNHIEGKNVDSDYLYSLNPNPPENNDLYEFPNQKHMIEKRYLYNVDVDYFKNILDDNTYNTIKQTELKAGLRYKTLEDTYIVYIGNNHKWMHVPVKLYHLIMKNINNRFIIVGGAANECLYDIYVALRSLGINVIPNTRYIWSAKYCMIK
jgi:hypothetical protein